jgi:hypothetical protein
MGGANEPVARPGSLFLSRKACSVVSRKAQFNLTLLATLPVTAVDMPMAHEVY